MMEKDIPPSLLKRSRPDVSPKNAVQFCRERLFEDKNHSINDQVVHGLSFLELIGALNLAWDLVKE